MVGAGPSRVGPWWGVPQPQGQAVPRLCGDSKSCSIPLGPVLGSLFSTFPVLVTFTIVPCVVLTPENCYFRTNSATVMNHSVTIRIFLLQDTQHTQHRDCVIYWETCF